MPHSRSSVVKPQPSRSCRCLATMARSRHLSGEGSRDNSAAREGGNFLGEHRFAAFRAAGKKICHTVKLSFARISVKYVVEAQKHRVCPAGRNKMKIHVIRRLAGTSPVWNFCPYGTKLCAQSRHHRQKKSAFLTVSYRLSFARISVKYVSSIAASGKVAIVFMTAHAAPRRGRQSGSRCLHPAACPDPGTASAGLPLGKPETDLNERCEPGK